MAIFDTSTPTGSEAISSGDDRIREFKEAMQNALRGDAAEGTESIFPGSAPSTNPVYRYRGLKGSTAARPSSGQCGRYFDTTRNVEQRDNGTSWDDVGTMIPAGTVMIFAQASAPVGWTKLTTQNDKALRIVSGSTGGAAGGTSAISGGIAHTHTIASHFHRVPAAAVAHKHTTTTIERESGAVAVVNASVLNGVDTPAVSNGVATSTFAGTSNVGSADWHHQFTSAMASYADGDTDAEALTSDSTAPVIAYVDVLQASKD